MNECKTLLMFKCTKPKCVQGTAQSGQRESDFAQFIFIHLTTIFFISVIKGFV